MNPPTDKPIYFFLEDLDYHIYRLDGHANQPFIVAARSINVGGKRHMPVGLQKASDRSHYFTHTCKEYKFYLIASSRIQHLS
jgi:hypothetical protein